MRLRLARLVFTPIILLAVATLGSALLAGPASAAPRVVADNGGAQAGDQHYGPKPCKITITITETKHGIKITIKISGSCHKDKIVVTIHSTPMALGTITTNASGNGEGTFSIPSSLPAGAHTITAADAQGNTGSAHLTLTRAATAAAVVVPKAPGPISGPDAATWWAVAAGSVGVIGLLVLGIRQRRHKSFT